MAFCHKKQASGWVTDPKGLPAAGWGLCLSPRDMTTIGQLALNQGAWNGRQLVSPSWIAESTSEHVRWGNLPYGYLWWILDGDGSAGSGIKEHGYAAMGDGGNIIYVNPEEQIVIAIACHFAPRAAARLELIDSYIIPMIQ